MTPDLPVIKTISDLIDNNRLERIRRDLGIKRTTLPVLVGRLNKLTRERLIEKLESYDKQDMRQYYSSEIVRYLLEGRGVKLEEVR